MAVSHAVPAPASASETSPRPPRRHRGHLPPHRRARRRAPSASPPPATSAPVEEEKLGVGARVARCTPETGRGTGDGIVEAAGEAREPLVIEQAR